MRYAGRGVRTNRIVVVISNGYGKSVPTARCKRMAWIWQGGISLVWPWSGRLVWPDGGRLVPPRNPVNGPLEIVIHSRTVVAGGLWPIGRSSGRPQQGRDDTAEKGSHANDDEESRARL